MTPFSDFSKHADHHDDPNQKKKPEKGVEDIARNRMDPKTGNEREDRESARDLQSNNNPKNAMPRERSQNRNDQQASRL